jgi:hypothetical protein
LALAGFYFLVKQKIITGTIFDGKNFSFLSAVKFYQFLGIKTLYSDLDPQLEKMRDPDPD